MMGTGLDSVAVIDVVVSLTLYFYLFTWSKFVDVHGAGLISGVVGE